MIACSHSEPTSDDLEPTNDAAALKPQEDSWIGMGSTRPEAFAEALSSLAMTLKVRITAVSEKARHASSSETARHASSSETARHASSSETVCGFEVTDSIEDIYQPTTNVRLIRRELEISSPELENFRITSKLSASIENNSTKESGSTTITLPPSGMNAVIDRATLFGCNIHESWSDGKGFQTTMSLATLEETEDRLKEKAD